MIAVLVTEADVLVTVITVSVRLLVERSRAVAMLPAPKSKARTDPARKHAMMPMARMNEPLLLCVVFLCRVDII